MVQPEVKQIDNQQTIAMAPNNGTSGSWSVPILLNGVPQGTSSAGRIGRKLHCHSLLLRLTPAVSTPFNGTPRVRVLVVHDNAPNTLNPTVSDILANSASSESPMNLGNADRFRIICDYYTNKEGFSAMSTSGVPEEPVFRKFSIDSTYGPGATGLITDITKGAILLLATTNMLNANLPTLIVNSRVRFTDV